MMSFLAFLFLIGLIVLFISLRNVKAALKSLTSRIDKLEQDIVSRKASESVEEKEAVMEPAPRLEPVRVPPPSIPPKAEPASEVPAPQTVFEELGPIELPPEAADAPELDTAKKESEWAARWKKFKENVDWEQFTGKKLTAWLGGLSLFIATGFFIKFSIERDLFPLELRLSIGALLGVLLILFSFSRRLKIDKYTVMRHTLAACGVGVLYAIVYAFIYYEYLTRPLGFGLLSLVSAAAFVLAVYHDGVAISVLGILAANATPILVSTGSGNIVILFIYLAVVNIGLYLVARRLGSRMLILTAAAGTIATLALATGANYYHLGGPTVAGVWIANLVLFSAFLWFSNVNPKDSQSTRWTAEILYLANVIIALVLLAKPGWPPMLTVTVSIFTAAVLAYRNEGWYGRVMPYFAVTFIIAFIWALFRFEPADFSFSFILILLYGAAGGFGPILLIRRHGPNKIALQWFRVFPAAVVAISLIAFFRDPHTSFWFWPTILCLQIISLGLSLLVRAFIQACVTILLLIAGGLFWIFNSPAALIGLGFFGFLLLAGIILCIAAFYFIRRLPDLIMSFAPNFYPDGSAVAGDGNLKLDGWLTAAPAMGAYVLIGAAFTVKHPLFPHAGMLTLVCFLALSLFLSRRIMFQAPAVVALLAAAAAQAVWVMNPANQPDLLFAAAAWSSALFFSALILPFVLFPQIERWKQVINAWALFEVIQGIFVLHAFSLYWNNDAVKWTPLMLAVLKLPVVAILLRRLAARPERNSIIAFHGGTLLFYFSALPVLVLDHGWIGLSFVFESAALLWLNRRIEHPGLRWTAVLMAPAGLLVLLLSVPLLKGIESLPVLNSAILSVGAAIVALSAAVGLSSFPNRNLRALDLPNYFRWIAVATGFYFINLVISDLFAGPGNGFKVVPDRNFLHFLCYALSWTAFGVALWRICRVSTVMRAFGFFLIAAGSIWLILLPILLAESVAAMQPLINVGLIAFLPLMALLYFVFIKEPWENRGGKIKNISLALFLLAGFMLVKVESSTIFQPGLSFGLLRPKTASMAVGSAAGWLVYGLGLLLWPRRLDRPFRISGIVLIFLGIVKALIFPFGFRAAFGDMTPLFNSPSILFLFLIASLVYLTLRQWKQPWPFAQLQPQSFWGLSLAVVTFTVLNIEIASAFAMKGRPFSMLSHGSLSMQLAYSIGWLIFSIGLMIVGMKWKKVKVRWAAIVLLVATAIKIFILDLWKLGQLYRVGSFIGLAVVLIMVSFLYQRFLSEGQKDESQTF